MKPVTLLVISIAVAAVGLCVVLTQCLRKEPFITIKKAAAKQRAAATPTAKQIAAARLAVAAAAATKTAAAKRRSVPVAVKTVVTKPKPTTRMFNQTVSYKQTAPALVTNAPISTANASYDAAMANVVECLSNTQDETARFVSCDTAFAQLNGLKGQHAVVDRILQAM